jgi:hypothetical protein
MTWTVSYPKGVWDSEGPQSLRSISARERSYMSFDLDKFRVRRPDESYWEADLPAILDHYQNRYFSDVKQQITSVEFVSSLEGPALVKPQVGRIEVDERVRNFPKLCCFLVLHELINNKLYWLCGREQDYSSPKFKKEVSAMRRRKAYDGLL